MLSRIRFLECKETSTENVSDDDWHWPRRRTWNARSRHIAKRKKLPRSKHPGFKGAEPGCRPSSSRSSLRRHRASSSRVVWALGRPPTNRTWPKKAAAGAVQEEVVRPIGYTGQLARPPRRRARPCPPAERGPRPRPPQPAASSRKVRVGVSDHDAYSEASDNLEHVPDDSRADSGTDTSRRQLLSAPRRLGQYQLATTAMMAATTGVASH